MRGVIQQFNDEHATVRFDDGQELRWPTRHLPTGLILGSVVEVKISEVQRATDDHAEASRQHLNKILSS
jgi:hypothetical protein